MDSRTAAHVLSQIAAYLQLVGENRFKSRAYDVAAKSIRTLGAEDLVPLYRSGALARMKGLGPATLAVIGDLIDHGESSYLEHLRGSAPEGLIELLRVPGLTAAKISQLHAALGAASLEELEEAARDGRLAALPGWGARTTAKLVKRIAFMRETAVLVPYQRGLAEARALVSMVRAHPGVHRAEVCGSVRRWGELVADIDIVAGCSADPESIATSFTRTGGVREAADAGSGAVKIRYVDGTRLDLSCVADNRFAVAMWRATGSVQHLALVSERLAARSLTPVGDEVHDRAGVRVPIPTEHRLYELAGMDYVQPELREGRGEVEAAARGALPRLIEYGDVRGVLHCHTDYSDGNASIGDMARAAQDRGWSYLGISDHSESAFFARGLSRDRVLAQHEEIDALNADLPEFRLLKGIEADILADGRIDYDAEVLDRFDYVIGSVHSRFAMDRAAMTRRVLTAMDDPHLTILGHPTGRLLLAREAYAIDMDAVLEKAAGAGVAVELNADPQRLDIEWRLLPRARAAGVAIAIGPDAHSPNGLDNVALGIGFARKGWLEAGSVLNTRGADGVIDFASARRDQRAPGGGR